jgi:hypothetical protein
VIVLPILMLLSVIAAIAAGAEFNWIAFIILAVALFGALYWISENVGMPVKITVIPENVIVNDKTMRRSEFGTFHIYETKTVQSGKIENKLINLGYSFGNRSFPLGGKWLSERKIQEFASALNMKLRATPLAGGAPSPEQLRAARPKKF